MLAGCGGGSASGDTPVIVSAASSLTEALTTCQKDVPGVSPKLSFAGSDELAAQIRRGVEPDVFLAANTSLPEDLAKDGLLDKLVEFATNQLVLAVPKRSQITTLGDLTKPGTSLVVGTKDVPFGAYTREVLTRLPAGTEKAILANVRSEGRTSRARSAS